jgi:hypothetical protein
MLPKHASTPLAWLLTAAVACFISVACATEKSSEQKEPESPPKAEKAEEPAEQEVKVYTNEDLEKLFGEEESMEPTRLPSVEQTPLPPADPSAEQEPVMEVKVEGEPPAKPASDPLTLMRERQAQAEERNRAIAEAEQAVATASARVEQLELRISALRNPFRARPDIPEDERAEWDSMGTRERLERTEEQLEQARADLAAAEQELAKIR